MNQVIDATGNVAHTIEVITPEIVDETTARRMPVVINHGKPRNEPIPPWMIQILKRQFRLSKRYKNARSRAIEIYNILIDEIDTINAEAETNFSVKKFVEEFDGGFGYDPDEAV
jgi:hypothetical protein